MKNKLKYILCTVLSVAVTFLIVAMPYFYYGVNDSRKTEFKPEKLSINTEIGNTPLVSQVARLVTSGNAIWIDDNENFSDFTMLQLVYAALQPLRESLKESDYAVSAIDLLMNDVDKKAALCETKIASGVVDDVPVSVRLMYVEFYGSDFIEASVLFDRNTDKVYQFSILTNDGMLNYDYNNDWDILMPDITTGLQSYYDYESDKELEYFTPIIVIDPNNFHINLFGVNYYEMIGNYGEMLSEVI